MTEKSVWKLRSIAVAITISGASQRPQWPLGGDHPERQFRDSLSA